MSEDTSTLGPRLGQQQQPYRDLVVHALPAVTKTYPQVAPS